MGVWRGRMAQLRRRWGALALAAALLAALGLRLPAEHRARAGFPRAPPHALAHLLADFSHQPNVGSWSVVDDGSNYTTWRYAVAFECGPRCAGSARVSAHAAPRAAAPEHGPAARLHRVTADLRACTHLPLLPWPTFCDEMETVAEVSPSAAGGGAELATRWRARCGVLRALSGACAAHVRAHHDELLRRVRTALDAQL